MKEAETALTRRALLRVLGGGTLAALVGATPGRAGQTEAPGGPVAEALARIGRRYLEIAPTDRDLAGLRAHLGAFANPATVLSQAAAFEAAVRRDFERGDILALDGWILSRTELRAAALFALTDEARP
jgi:hypothetical protein